MGDHQVNCPLLSVCVLCYQPSCHNFLHLTTVLKCVATKIFFQCLKNYSCLATTFPYTSTITVSLGFLLRNYFLINLHNIHLTNGATVRCRNRNIYRQYKHFGRNKIMSFERLITFQFLSQICLDYKPDRRVGKVGASVRVVKENVIFHGLIK